MHVQLYPRMNETSFIIFYGYKDIFFFLPMHLFLFLPLGISFISLWYWDVFFQNVQTDKEYVTRNQQGKKVKENALKSQ